MSVFCVYLLLKVLESLYVCAGSEDLDSEEGKFNELIPEIYNVYLEAFKENKNAVTRRLINENNQYELHINKLREVNGIKTHNVLIARTSATDESLIYINNPVESHIPYAFLSQEQFKQHLMDNIKKQHKEFSEQKLKKSLNMFKFKPKKKENKKPFVWSLLKTPTNKTKQQKKKIIKTSTKSVSDEVEEELSSTTVIIPIKETTTDKLRDLITAKLNEETLATEKSSTNTPESTDRSISEDPMTNNSESLIENYTDPRDYGENVTPGYQEELNVTIVDDATVTEDNENTFTETNTPSTVIITDTSETETSEVTTTGTTKSTPSTRGGDKPISLGFIFRKFTITTGHSETVRVYELRPVLILISFVTINYEIMLLLVVARGSARVYVGYRGK